MKNPWKKKSSKEIYSNPWITVREDNVITPGGKDGIYGVVSFKNIATGVLPIDDEGYTYLVGQFRYPLETYSWEIPEGGCPEGENPLDAAKRELLEETGIIANHWEEFLTIHTSNSVCKEIGYVFLAKDLTFQEAQPEETEDLSVKKVHFSEALDMCLRGDITDSISVAAILKAKLIFNL